MSPTEWQVQVRRNPDDWEGVRADEAVIERSGALTFYEIENVGFSAERKHIISYGPHAWFTYWRDEMPEPR